MSAPDFNDELSRIPDAETEDGRKIVAVSSSGVALTLETSEQAAKGRREEIAEELDRIKLASARRGIRFHKFR